MSNVIRFVPGVLGAFTGFIALKLFPLLGVGLVWEFVLFIGVYLTVTALADKAQRRSAQS
ncbi:hypothetical protein [Nitrosococcus wardiae]|uniref:Uncharacterized protein n=1 Tax=Nitrosococcus wardiae TaxID=1814290 RepID=A0A4P7BXI1_9GAMM|nr:hypothetical protein [Nitrosococcus wardiae]QBQ53854.1 hypothetical protein E3U44_04505 [Nitrosococcus wardiae]